jgi:hypothetical protein
MKVFSHQKVAGSAKVGLRTGSTAAQASMHTSRGFVSRNGLEKVGNQAYLPCLRQFYCQHNDVITFYLNKILRPHTLAELFCLLWKGSCI